ncbi:hypothetical protein [Erythrobacter mangrovi]|uniref:Uncharacterized protein n=1 Tax=Erythrobacter mangrovi TaxID=2739433 RepID=A0A7D4BPD2_9SPHN|nr:hypothetical protein [Erythrobacter mangrovi]QKG71884.1 hypothetical protein HQR01_11235 [Erythrobacter mangrovi]
MEYAIEIDASRGLVKATGDRAFVESVIEKYETLMAVKAPAAPPGPNLSAPMATEEMQQHAPNGSSASEGNLQNYGSVFDVTDGKVSIIADIPGNTQAAKAKNICLLYLFAKMKLGEEIVANEEIREACKAHAVYDQTNFATQMKGQKKLVIASGPKGSPSFTLKLTVPGKKAAEELAKELEASS